jgi:nucleoside-diphosphate-sugar epimerase
MVLLTGYTGYLGRYIFNEIVKTNKIITLSRNLSASIVCDLSTNFFRISEPINIVIHCAGLAHIDDNGNEASELFYKTNVGGTLNLINSLETSNVIPRYFVFISSVSVYGVKEGRNISETESLNACDAYGKSKIEAEKLITAWCAKNNIVCTIFRLPLIIGANPPGNLGQMIRSIKNRYYFNIAGGNAQKSAVLASDVSKFILTASQVGGVYNLTDGFHPTFYGLSKKINLSFGKTFIPNMPYFLAKVLALFGDLIGQKFPINSIKLNKINSTLTFDDSNARMSFGWTPTPVLSADWQ